ncbi:peptide synthase [Thermobifida halotolerans]|uniref:Peptide synthase n=1 Tax=Thermobifida halotolerans TaxID=483545 RepID=A0A399G830_9ACTN|nr:condensation domain-containing protein [Thermobifida halotolerans]UOE21120.1 peptide synthase [Thermobifida halotolerans]
MSVTVTSDGASPPESGIPLSSTQEFLCMFNDGSDEGPFGPMYHVVRGWRVRGAIDVAALRGALGDVVERHEALRTAIVRGGQVPHQRILPARPPKLLVQDISVPDPRLRDRRVEEFLNEVEATEHHVGDLPLLRAVLGRLDDDDAVLALLAHHTACDGWSLRLIMRDLASLYAARSGHEAPELPEARQYREYTLWQRTDPTADRTREARDYWRDKLREARLLAVPTDRPKTDRVGRTTSTRRFLIDADLTSATLRFSASMRCSPFMVLLSAYNLLLHRRTGETDVVVPTITSGRGHARFEETVGSFFNFLPLRTDLSDCATAREVVERTRATCLGAQRHDIPFAQILEESPQLMQAASDPARALCAFQVFQNPFVLDGRSIGDLEYSEVRRRLLSQPVSSDIPDGALWTLDIDPSGEMFGNLKFDGEEFDESTVDGMIEDFRRLLRQVVTAPDAPAGVVSD